MAESQDSIATADDFDNLGDYFTTIPAPELGPGKKIRVLHPNVEQLEELRAQDFPPGATRRTKGYLQRWALACVVNEKGEKILAPDKVAAMAKKSAVLMERIYNAASEGPAVTDAAITTQVKNS